MVRATLELQKKRRYTKRPYKPKADTISKELYKKHYKTKARRKQKRRTRIIRPTTTKHSPVCGRGHNKGT
jgi:TFIIF-interacting CTD phosphatase-like protein